MNTTQGALILEKILTDPRARAALQVLNRAAPLHQRDQLAAAERDTTKLMSAIGTHLGNHTETWHDLGATPGWLRLEVLARVSGYMAHTIDTCVHNPHAEQLAPVFAAACRPNLITCMLCTHLLQMRSGSDADRTCDACGHICAGLDQGEGIYPGVSRYGLLVFMYGTCADCRPAYQGSA